jgi:hypothetical protein
MRKLHKTLGLIMLLPFIAWTITGVFFFIKPGYQQAYQPLNIKTYPLQTAVSLEPLTGWLAFEWRRSILGDHLMVKTADGWSQLDPVTFDPIAQASEQQIRQLVNDAIATNKPRYGEIVKVEGNHVFTDQSIEINLHWPQLKLSQKGPDTDFINQMYKVHYLQWTGIESIDRVMGIIGLAAVLMLALIGLKLALKRVKFVNR